MSRAVSVSGDAEIDLNDVARRAARRDGLSLREWLDSAVNQRAADLGVDPEDLGSEDRIGAVSDRLRDLASGTRRLATGTLPRLAAREPAGQASSNRPLFNGEAGVSRITPEAKARPRVQMSAARFGADPQSLVRPVEGRNETQVADHSRRKSDRFPRRDERNQAESDGAAVSGRGRSLASRRGAAGASQDLDDLSKVEAKLTALFRALDRKPQTVPDLPAQDDTAAASRATPEAVLSETAMPPGAIERARTVLHRMPAATQPTRTMAQAIAEIADRQAFLDSVAPSSTMPPETGGANAKAVSSPDHRSRAVASDLLARFGLNVDALPARANRSAESGSTDIIPAMAALRREIAAISQAGDGVAPSDDGASLEAAVRDLSDKVAGSREAGLRDVVLEPVERLARELRASLREIDPRAAVKDLDREIRALGGRIESLAAQKVDADALRRIREQTAEVRDLLTVAATRPLPIDRVERQIADLDSRVEKLVQAPSREPPSDAVALADLRSMLNGLQSSKGVEVLEERVNALAAKIDAAMAGQLQPAAFDQLAARIETVNASLEARLAEPATPVVDLAPVEGMIQDLIGRFDSMRQDTGDLRSLETMVQRLAAKLDDARDPYADAQVFAELQAQVAKLAARIDRSDAGLTAIVSVERSLGDLFSQLEETREAAISAAEGAARTAARDTLRAAMLDASLPARPGAGLADETVEHVTQELLQLRSAREAADQRLSVILSAVNQTLEQVVARLAVLEEAPAKASAPPAARAGIAARPGPRDAVPSNHSRLGQELASAGNANPGGKGRGQGDRSRQVFDLGEPDFPIEPGTNAVRPRVTASGAGAPDVKADPAQFIAAARRAAQAAAADSASRASAASASRARGAASPSPEAGRPLLERARVYAAGSRRPLLLSLAGLVLLLGAAQVARLSLANPNSVKEVAATSAGSEVGQASGARPQLAAPGAAVKSTASADSTKLPLEVEQAAAPEAAPAKALPTLAMGFGGARAANPGYETPAGLGDGLRDMAADGNAAAEYEVALRLADSRSVTRDPKAAAGWFEKAARQGLAPAAYRLGSLYEKGLGVTRDPAQAVDWYQKAADAGNVRAMHNLAVMSAEGAGGKSDYVKAAQWFTKASQMGVRDSQFNLAILYARGLGIEQSLAESYKWFAIAAAQGDTDAAKKRDDVAARLDAKALAAAKAAAEDFKPIKPLQAANDVQAPPGGWDAVAPTHSAPAASPAGKAQPTPRVSSL